MTAKSPGRVMKKNARMTATRGQSAPHANNAQGKPPPPDKLQKSTNENSAQQLTITWIMFAEPEAADRSERRMSELPPRQDAEGVRAAALIAQRERRLAEAARFGSGDPEAA